MSNHAGLLNRFVQISKSRAEFIWAPAQTVGPGQQQYWSVTLQVAGVPYQSQGTGATKKSAQEQATENFVEYLSNTGLIDQLPPPKKLRLNGASSAFQPLQPFQPPKALQEALAAQAAKAGRQVWPPPPPPPEPEPELLALPAPALLPAGPARNILDLPSEVVANAVATGVPLSELVSGCGGSESTTGEGGSQKDPAAAAAHAAALGFVSEDLASGEDEAAAILAATAELEVAFAEAASAAQRPELPGYLPPGRVVAGSANSFPQQKFFGMQPVYQAIDSQFQEMLSFLKKGSPDEALLSAQRRLWRMPGALQVSQLAKLIQSVGLRGNSEAMIRFLDGIEAMNLTCYPDQAGSAYFNRFARWSVRELLAQASQTIEDVGRRPVVALELAGLCIPYLVARMGKGGVEMHLVPSQPLAPGHQFLKGDWVFVTFPHDAEVAGANSFEGELLAFLGPTSSEPLVKITGSTSDVLTKYAGMTCRVDRAANRVTFSRQVEALKLLCIGQQGTGAQGWLRQVLIAADEEEGVLASAGLEKTLCGEHNQVLGGAASSPIWSQGNSSQREALKAAMCRRLTLVQGPPGSGKTHTAVLLVRLWLVAGRGPVLCSADSNVAVDNLLSGCAKAGLEVVRVGRPEATRPDLERYNLLEQAGGSHAPDGASGQLWSAERRILSRAEVVCCTCSGSDHPVLQGMEFPSVIIDEAAQATEPSVLVPLLRMHPQGSVALIGDHRQLPPTVVDLEVEAEGYGTPLFERLVSRGVEPVMLNVQYRMHPAIACFPSMRYYEGQLRSGVCGLKRRAPRGIRWPDRRVPLAFLPVEGRESREGSSYCNHAEVAAIETLLLSVLRAGDIGFEDIGIITPYDAQARLLRRAFGGVDPKKVRDAALVGGLQRRGGLEISSVDGFQGREKELVVVSTVRANPAGRVGFLADPRRLNVAITRARRGLLVCGHMPTLSRDSLGWGPWISWVRDRGLVAGLGPGSVEAARQLLSLDSMTEDQLLGVAVVC